VQGVHIVRKECVDRGELTSEKQSGEIALKPSPTEVQGVHRKNFVVSSERDKVTEHSVTRSSARCASSKQNAKRERRIYFQEIFRI
jgi:hypothetical protein